MPETRSTAHGGNSISGFLLAGGQSRRMGRDKAALEWRGEPLIDHMVHLLSTAADSVQIIGRGNLPDRIASRGPLGGILTALEVSPTPKTLILALDLPLLTPDFLQAFRDRWLRTPRHILASKIGSHYPLCLGVDQVLAGEVERRVREGNLAVQRLIEETDAEIWEEEDLQRSGFPSSMFANVNTPRDWASLDDESKLPS